jgi:hypothetical protein
VLKKLLSAGRVHEAKVELESAVEELYAFFYADHTTKVK